jgi:phage terminase large subunit
MSHYFDVVDAKPYQYVKHWLPHDARAKTLQTGSSILEQAMQHWPGKVGIVPQLSISDGLQAGRWLLQQQIRIHPRCGEGIEALRQYHYEYDEDTKAFGMKPEHDWSSHTADAFRYLACVVKHSELITRKAAPPKPAEQRGHDQTWTLDKLFADNEADKHGRRRI